MENRGILMKIIKKIKKVIISAIIAIVLLPKKIFASIDPGVLETLYGPRNEQVLYGVRSPISSIWNIAKIFIIPLALIIGFIIYFKKSKSTTKRKIITMIIVLLIVIAICWGLNYLITNL